MPDFSFQAEAVAQVMAALGEYQSVLLQAPTGAGKTQMATEIARQCEPPVMFVAESREIIRQTVDAFKGQGLETDALTSDVKTGHQAEFNDFGVPYVIASQKTAWSRAVRAKHDLGEYRTIIIDEAHHIRARTYHELLDCWPDAKRVLLTATPVRGDGKGLGNLADAMVQGDDYGGNYSHLTSSGVLVPCPRDKVWSWPVDLRGVRKQAGDYSMGGAKGASKVMDTPKLVGDIVRHWKDLAEDRPTIVYTTSVAHAQHLEEAFKAEGVPAATVHAETSKADRDRYLAGLEFGEFKVVCNFAVLTEGFDCPPVSCIVLARPTQLFGLYIQMVGRGLRACEGKGDLMVLDHAGIVPKHGMPGSDIEWKLTETDDAALSKEPRAIPCPECNAILLSTGKCGACGWEPERRSVVQNGSGWQNEHESDRHAVEVNLVRMSDQKRAEITADMQAPERSEFHRLKAVAEQKGLKPGWAAYRFKERYGEWPKDTWHLPNPLTCGPEMYLAAARAFAAEKGWKPGWAAHKYKEVYGEWPTR